MSPFYRRLPTAPGFGIEVTADKIGAGLAAATAAGFAIHGVSSALRHFKKDEKEEKEEKE
jgi:hydrogenase small subunit